MGRLSKGFLFKTAVPQSFIVGTTFFLPYIDDLCELFVFTIIFYAVDNTLYDRHVQALDQQQKVELAFELESVLLDIVDQYRKSIIDFNAGKLNLNHLIVQMTLVVLMLTWIGPSLIKNHLLRCQYCPFSWKQVQSPCIVSSAKTASKKIRALIPSVKIFPFEVAHHINKSSIQRFMQHLDKLEKQVYWTVGPDHCQQKRHFGIFLQFFFFQSL